MCWVWAPVLLWMSLILWLSSRSDLPVRTNPQTGETIKTTFTVAKIAHVVEYSVLALLLLRALMSAHGGARLAFKVAAFCTVVACGLFGGLDELRQSLVPNREPRLFDVALDTVSALAVCVGVAVWRRYREFGGAAREIKSRAPDDLRRSGTQAPAEQPQARG